MQSRFCACKDSRGPRWMIDIMSIKIRFCSIIFQTGIPIPPEKRKSILQDGCIFSESQKIQAVFFPLRNFFNVFLQYRLLTSNILFTEYHKRCNEFLCNLARLPIKHQPTHLHVVVCKDSNRIVSQDAGEKCCLICCEKLHHYRKIHRFSRGHYRHL